MANTYYSGIEAGKQIYFSNLRTYGTNERKYSLKTMETCRKYAYDESLRITKKGVPLTRTKRVFYKGIADFLQNPNQSR